MVVLSEPGRTTAQMKAIFDPLTSAAQSRKPIGDYPSMSEKQLLTAEEVSERYRGMLSLGTLRNWRSMRIGPSFLKIGKSVLYPVSELQAWDRRNLMKCQHSNQSDWHPAALPAQSWAEGAHSPAIAAPDCPAIDGSASAHRSCRSPDLPATRHPRPHKP